MCPPARHQLLAAVVFQLRTKGRVGSGVDDEA
jgi:hypothetical protein